MNYPKAVSHFRAFVAGMLTLTCVSSAGAKTQPEPAIVAGRPSLIRALLAVLVLAAACFPLRAEKVIVIYDFGPLTYMDYGDAIQIFGCQKEFAGMLEIPSLLDGKPVERISDWAFVDCTGLTGVTLPAQLNYIGHTAFRNCRSLTTVSIPAGVQEIGAEAFTGCTSLRSIDVAPGNQAYRSFEGVLIGNAGTRLLKCPEGKTGDFSIPEGIVDCAGGFANCTGLTSVRIPSSMTAAGSFRGCIGLQAIEVEPSNPNYSSIGGVLFNRDASTLAVYPPGRPGAYAIPSSVARIGEDAFSGCAALTEITIPAVTTGIGASLFQGCLSLRSIEVAPGNPWYASLDGVLFSKSVQTLIFCPRARGGAYAIPPGVVRIGIKAFAGCASLSEITMPPTLTEIAEEALGDCAGLAALPIPNGVVKIGERAFWRCTGLGSISIPSSVISPIRTAFTGCSRLKSIDVTAGNPMYASSGGVLFDAARSALVACPEGRPGAFVIPPGTTSIWAGAFQGCALLTRVSLPMGITAIENLTFSNCTSLLEVNLPDGLRSIGWHAFEYCSSLGSIIFPTSVTSIYESFWICPSLVKAVFPGSAPTVDYGLRFFSGPTPFYGTAAGFTVHFFGGRAGFTTPTWWGYPSVVVNEAVYPAAPWLLEHGLWYDTNLHQDPDGDGVNLLMAYALNLNPHGNVLAALPVPVLDDYSFRLTFYAASRGITYRVETSTDLQNWTESEVNYMPSFGPDRKTTASVSPDGPARFLRLVVEKN